MYVHVYVFVPPHGGSGLTTGPVGIIAAPHELVTVGGVGTTCASDKHGATEPPGAGKLNVGGLIVYVNTYCTVLFVQSVYVHVYVFVPEHIGSAPITGPVTDAGAPHELFTTGGVGTTCASLIHATVALPGAGAVMVGGNIVYVYTHGVDAPEQSMYIHVYVFGPEHAGSAPTTGPVGVIGLPQLSFTFGGVGTTCASLMHATVLPPAGGRDAVGALIV